MDYPAKASVARILPVICLPLIAYLITAPHSITLEDAGLFQMVCTQGGISHPPGYPLFTLLCQNLPVSEEILTGNLLSAIFGLLALATFYLLMNAWFKPVIAASIVLAYGFSLTFWQQSIIIEVYTLAAFLFYLDWLLLDRFVRTRDWRYWFLACLVFGLALSNHWPLMLLSTPALLSVTWPVLKEEFGAFFQPARVLIALGCFMAGLLPYASLLMSDASKFGIFGHVTNMPELVSYVLRAPYDDAHASADWSDKLLYLAWLLPEATRQYSVPGALAALAGLILMVRDRHPLLIPSLLNFLGATIGLTMLLGFEFDAPGQSVFRPYPIIAWGSMAIWLGFAAVWAGKQVNRRYVQSAGLTILISIIVLVNFSKADRSSETWVEDYFSSLLNALPDNAVLFVDGDLLSFPLGYLHFVQKHRTDITLLNWSSLTYPNRLSPVMASREEKEATIVQYVTDSSEPIFVIEPTLAPLTRFGWFNQVNRKDPLASVIRPDAELAMDKVLDQYLSNNLQHQQEFELADFILASFTRLYINHQQAGSVLDATQQQRFRLLLSTYPAKMILIEHELENSKTPDKLLLLDVLRDAETQVPGYLSHEKRVRLGKLEDRIHGLPDLELNR